MYLVPRDFEVRHDGSVTTLRVVSEPNHPGERASSAGGTTPCPLPAFEDAKVVFGCVFFAVGSLSVLIAVPFGMFPGSALEQIITAGTALFGLLVSIAFGLFFIMPLLRGPIQEMRIDRARARVDVVETDFRTGLPRVKTAPIAAVRINVAKIGDVDAVVVGTISLFGFTLSMNPAPLGLSAVELKRQLSTALGRDDVDGRGIIRPPETAPH